MGELHWEQNAFMVRAHSVKPQGSAVSPRFLFDLIDPLKAVSVAGSYIIVRCICGASQNYPLKNVSF